MSTIEATTYDPLTQRRDALARANAIRLGIAKAKQQITAGELDWREVIQGKHPDLRTMPVEAVMRAVPRLGPQKVSILLAHNMIGPKRRVHQLTARQVEALTAPLVGALLQEFPERMRPTMHEVQGRLRRAERERDELRALAARLDGENRRLREQRNTA